MLETPHGASTRHSAACPTRGGTPEVPVRPHDASHLDATLQASRPALGAAKLLAPAGHSPNEARHFPMSTDVGRSGSLPSFMRSFTSAPSVEYRSIMTSSSHSQARWLMLGSE
jgi:hypothetical protein